MLEALILALGLTDQSFFSKADLRDPFMELLDSIQSQNVVVLLGSPAIVDAAKNRDLPLFLAYKWQSGKAGFSFPPADFANIIVSSLADGTVDVFPIVDFSHKMPLADEPERTPAPPGTDDADDVTISYDAVWRDLPISIMDLAGDRAAIAVLCGPSWSNKATVEIKNRQSSEVKKSGIENGHSASPEYYFAKNENSPGIPAKKGIVFSSLKKATAKAGKPFMIYGSFSVPYEAGRKEPVILNVLLSRADAPGIHILKVTIPRKMLSIAENSARGYFSVDLMAGFYWSDAGRFEIPQALYVSAVCKELFSDPMLLELQQLK